MCVGSGEVANDQLPDKPNAYLHPLLIGPFGWTVCVCVSMTVLDRNFSYYLTYGICMADSDRVHV